uniref:Uncharacterized protein n=1 Tax=Streptomyces sp. NBC_00003 TaxID=2903608 RepID=A0AAU2VF23_9ACTN
MGALTTALAAARATVNELKNEAFRAGYRVPNAMDSAALWRTERDRPREEGGSPRWAEADVYSFTSFDRAEQAWKNRLDPRAGKRAEPWVGWSS